MTTLDELLRRVKQLEDVAAIERLASEYCIGADAQDLRLWERVWTEDAVWQAGEDEEHIFRGRTAISAAVQAQWATFPRMQHASTNHVVDLLGEGRARGRSDVVVIVQLPDLQWVIGGGTYQDEYRREGGSWRIRSRRVTDPFDLDPVPGSTGPRGVDGPDDEGLPGSDR